jgi:hypothetical protein
LTKNEDKRAISLLLNWFKQLMVHGHRKSIDYQALEIIYHSKEEVKTMLENAIAKKRQTFYDRGKSEGKLEDKLEGKLETAKAMLAKGFEISLIIEVTNLSLKEIEQLKHLDSFLFLGIIFALIEVNYICGASATIFPQMWLFCVALSLKIMLDFMPVKSYVTVSKEKCS